MVDIGCGCGVTTLAAAGLALDGLAFGIDVSAPMLEVAIQRAMASRSGREPGS